MQAAVWIYRLYDIAQEIDLERAEAILAGAKPVSRLRLSKVGPKSISFKNPPLTVELDHRNGGPPDLDFPFTVTARIYDLGVVTVLLRVTLPEDHDYEALKLLAFRLAEPEALEKVFWNHLETVREALRPALDGESYQGFVEDFTIFYFREWDDTWDPVPLLLGEREEVSAEQRRETLKHRFSYGAEDFTILNWDTAIVYDRSGSSDIPDLLEFANAQLLELRYYDNVLDQELERMYDAFEEAEAGTGFRRLNRYRRIMKDLLQLVADITAITGRIHNALRVTEDVFYARVYTAQIKVLRIKEWTDSITQKVEVVERSYSMLSDEIITFRFTVLEAVIVVLIAVEIVIWLATL